VNLNPNLSMGWLSRGWISVMQGRAERAIESFENLLRLSPLDPLRPFSLSGIAFALFFQGRYEEGRLIGKEIMQLFPHHQSYAAYIVNCVGAGDIAEARSAANLYLKFDPNFCLSRAPAIFVVNAPDMRKKFDDALRAAGIPK
jgi:adenylate cyclase